MLPNTKEPIPTLLLANKCDIPGVVIDKEALDKFVKENGFIGWYEGSSVPLINMIRFETSAQQNTNIGTA